MAIQTTPEVSVITTEPSFTEEEWEARSKAKRLKRKREDAAYSAFDDSDDEDNYTGAKPPTPKLANFSGKDEEWLQWRRSANGKLGSLEFGKLLESREMADRHDRLN